MKLLCCICGMEINNKNMNSNSAAFAGKNNEHAIEFCPFCGAGKSYLVEEANLCSIGEVAEIDSNTLKILDHAFKLELFNADFYKKAAELAKDSKIKDMFKGLARIEYVHAIVHQRLGAFKEIPKLKDISYDKYDKDELLLEQAKLREKHAVEYYRKYMNSVGSEAVKEVLKVLESVEMQHIVLLCN